MGEFLRTDEPPVRNAAEGEVSCAGCSYWSRWLERTGDCMLYALRRRRAFVGARNLNAVSDAWPAKSARVTSDDETCWGWEARS